MPATHPIAVPELGALPLQRIGRQGADLAEVAAQDTAIDGNVVGNHEAAVRTQRQHVAIKAEQTAPCFAATRAEQPQPSVVDERDGLCSANAPSAERDATFSPPRT
jgi:hypothetical protein